MDQTKQYKEHTEIIIGYSLYCSADMSLSCVSVWDALLAKINGHGCSCQCVWPFLLSLQMVYWTTAQMWHKTWIWWAGGSWVEPTALEDCSIGMEEEDRREGGRDRKGGRERVFFTTSLHNILPVEVFQSIAAYGVHGNADSAPGSAYNGGSSSYDPHQWSCTSSESRAMYIHYWYK